MFKTIKYILNQKKIEEVENIFNNIFELEDKSTNTYEVLHVSNLREKLFWLGIKENEYETKKQTMHFINHCIFKLHSTSELKNNKSLYSLLVTLKLELIS